VPRNTATVENNADSQRDFQPKLECLWTLLRLCKHNGAKVLIYLQPRRSTIPSALDPDVERQVNVELVQRAGILGFTVIDARHALPDAAFGYDGLHGDAPSPNHLAHQGLEMLAEFLADEIERRHLWPPQPQSVGR